MDQSRWARKGQSVLKILRYQQILSKTSSLGDRPGNRRRFATEKVGCAENHRRPRDRPVPAQLLDEFLPVHCRHQNVADDKVRVFRSRERQRLRPSAASMSRWSRYPRSVTRNSRFTARSSTINMVSI